MIVEISELEYEGQVFKLNRPLLLSFECWDGHLWICENNDLNLSGSGKSKEEALKSLSQDFADFYHEIALEKDENLEEKAIEMKRRFLDLLESVLLPLRTKE